MCEEQSDSLWSILLSNIKDCSSLSAVLRNYTDGRWSSEKVLTCARQCLSLFVQLNWTGPPSPGPQIHDIVGEEKWRELNKDALEKFNIDGISPYQLCSGAVFLHMATVLVQYISDHYQSLCGKSQEGHIASDKGQTLSDKEGTEQKRQFTSDEGHLDQVLSASDREDQLLRGIEWKGQSDKEKTSGKEEESLCVKGDRAPHDSLEVLVLVMRCLYKHQQLLDERSSTLWNHLTATMDTININITTNDISRTEKSELYLEMGHISLFYLQYDLAQDYFEKARKLNGIQATLTGALGRRTRFQEKDTAQLVLQVTCSSCSADHTSQADSASSTDSACPVEAALPSGSSNISQFPREVRLDDDTVLDKMELAAASSHSCSLNSLQQATLLALCCHNRKTKPVDVLTDEETDAYLTCILEKPVSWAVQTSALFLKSVSSKHRPRLKQRSMQQLEELVQVHGRSEPSMKERISIFYTVPLPPLWGVQKELAESLMTLGCYGSAVEILQCLQLWEELALCYVATDRLAKARELVQQQLDKEATPSLLCLMGDITRDIGYYEKAWQVSGCRSARAQKSLGLQYMKNKEWTKCVESLQLSLKVNPLQEGLWFTLACAASYIQDVDLSIKAGHQAVTLDPNSAEAWNNLAGAYLKKKNKSKAQRLFKEALRCSYDNTKIWENYLVVSAEVGKWAECMEACHRLLDLGAGHVVDSEILAVLMEAVYEDNLKEGTASAASLHESLRKLLARATSQKSVPAEVWHVCAQFHMKSTNPADHVKGVTELQKAQRMSRQVAGWEKDLKSLTRVTQLTLEYCRACRRVYGQSDATSMGSSGEIKAAFSSAKLALQGVLAKVKSFGLTSDDQVEKMLQDLQEEKELLLQLS